MSDTTTISTRGLGNGVKALVERIFDESGLCAHRGPLAILAESEADIVGEEVFIQLTIVRRPDIAELAFAGAGEVN